VDAPLLAAGCLGLLAAAVHGAGGEVLVVRKLSLDLLPPSRFGGPQMTKAMIHVTWHVTTFAFLSCGAAMLIAATALEGDARQAVGVFGAVAFTGFAVVAMGIGGAHMRSPRGLLTHPGPLVLGATAALAWWGAALAG
jgi:hypothetical protein